MRRNKKDSNSDYELDGILLATLRDCQITTKSGLVDKGNPNKLQRLAALGFTSPKDGGYQVTDEGRAYMNLHKRELLKL